MKVYVVSQPKANNKIVGVFFKKKTAQEIIKNYATTFPFISSDFLIKEFKVQ